MLQLNYKTQLEINTTPEADPVSATWEKVCDGFTNLAESLNEVLYQASYLCSEGWGSTEVTGGQYIVTLTGKRKVGDPAQDYIFSDVVRMGFGENRKTQLRITKGEKVIEWDITLANITDAGGDSQQPSDVTVTIHGNGAPRLDVVAP